MRKLQEVIRHYHDIVLYIVFGVLTTIVNIVVYYLCFDVLDIANVISTVLAWIVSVLFAFITNKIWVFESKSFYKDVFLHELISFFSCRIATGLLDIVIMYVAVDLLMQDEILWKLVANIVVIVINYIASKLLIFKKPRDKQI